MDLYKKVRKRLKRVKRSNSNEVRSFGAFEPDAPARARQKSLRVLRDLIFVFLVFAVAFVLASVFDLHNSFEAASLQMKESPFQYDEVIVALALLAAALSVFAIRRWRELEKEIVERISVEGQLVDSEERYRTLAEAAQDFIFIVNKDGLIRYVNSFAAGKLGKPANEFVGKRFEQTFPKAMAVSQKKELKRVVASGQSLYVENEADFGGERIWLSTALVPILDEAGGFEEILGISRDITEHKRAEDSLQKTKDGLEAMVGQRTAELNNVNQRLNLELDEKMLAEERLQAVNRALRTTMAVSRALTEAVGEEQLLLDICKAVVEVGGYRFAWVGIAERADMLIVPAAHAGYEDGFLAAVEHSWDEGNDLGAGPAGRAVRSGTPSVVRDLVVDRSFAPWRPEAMKRGYASTVSLPLTGEAGTYGTLSIYAAEPDAFDQEEVRLLSKLAQDLSYGMEALRTKGERDEQALTLRRVGEQLSLLLESMPIIFYTSSVEEDYGLTYVSKNVSTFTGFSADELLGDPSFWADHIHPDDTARVFEEMAKVFAKGFHQYEYRWRSADGAYKWFLDILRLVKSPEGEEDYIVGMWLDITARKHGEERLLAVKDRLEEEAREKANELGGLRRRLSEVSADLEKYQLQAGLISQMDELLLGCFSESEAYSAFARYLADLDPGGSGALYVLKQDTGRYDSVSVWGDAPPTIHDFASEDCWSLRLGQVHVYSGSEAALKCPHVDFSGDYTCCPIRVAGDLFGVLVMLPPASETSGGAGSGKRKELAGTLAGHLGMALYGLRMRSQLDETKTGRGKAKRLRSR